MSKKRLLIIFVKNPEPGKCKTRLAATIGDEKALDIYKVLLERTKEVATEVQADKAVYYSSFIAKDDIWPEKEEFSKHLQADGGLGNKMSKAFFHSFQAGYESVCIIGSDCYELTTEKIHKAFEVLERRGAVLGPSTDGGYYLLGMNELIPELFENKEWSSETVAEQTCKDLEQLDISYEKLEPLTDIDTEEDLKTMSEEVVEKILKKN